MPIEGGNLLHIASSFASLSAECLAVLWYSLQLINTEEHRAIVRENIEAKFVPACEVISEGEVLVEELAGEVRVAAAMVQEGEIVRRLALQLLPSTCLLAR